MNWRAVISTLFLILSLINFTSGHIILGIVQLIVAILYGYMVYQERRDRLPVYVTKRIVTHVYSNVQPTPPPPPPPEIKPKKRETF